jgi:hypothetical protein
MYDTSEQYVGLAQGFMDMPDTFAVFREQHRIAGTQLDRLTTIGGKRAGAADDMAELTVLQMATENTRGALPYTDAGVDNIIRLVLASCGMRHYFSDGQSGRRHLTQRGLGGLTDNSKNLAQWHFLGLIGEVESTLFIEAIE